MSPLEFAATLLLAGTTIGSVSVAAILWMRLSRQNEQQKASGDEARDLAMRVVLSLDDLVGACYSAANDFPDVDVDDPSSFFFHTDDPALLLPKDVNWSFLGRELSDEVRWMPNRLRNLTDALESIKIDPPDYKDLFERRQDGFARLGLRTMDLVEKICERFELPLPERPAYYNPRRDFLSKIREMEEFWRRQTETARQVPSEKSNITPIFGRGMPDNQPS
ncbi:MAG: hypothetical protein KGI75_00205 [Rhizobiaceae bacterium]|nr:hypothetical protein [Rhizobiaceae bacterium]